jgi:hypothetical protein
MDEDKLTATGDSQTLLTASTIRPAFLYPYSQIFNHHFTAEWVYFEQADLTFGAFPAVHERVQRLGLRLST